MKVLLVSRHFPPVPSGGARRPYLMAQALKSAGADVFVVSLAEPTTLPGVVVPHRQPEPPADVEVLGRPIWRWDWRRWARELMRWPDPDAAWCREAARIAAAEVPFVPDWIVTSSPPESLLLTGSILKHRFGARWLADFRDCWLSPPRRPERRMLFRRLGERLQARQLLARPDVVTAVDAVVASEVAALGAIAPIIVPQLMPQRMAGKPLSPADRIHVVYTGQFSISDSGRSIRQLLEPFEAACRLNSRLFLHIAGHLTVSERQALRQSPAAEAIKFHGALPFDRILKIQSAADGLVVVSSEGGWAVPGKLCEYWVTGVPIVAIGNGPWRASAGIPESSDPISELAALSKANKLPEPPKDVGRQLFLSQFSL